MAAQQLGLLAGQPAFSHFRNLSLVSSLSPMTNFLLHARRDLPSAITLTTITHHSTCRGKNHFW